MKNSRSIFTMLLTAMVMALAPITAFAAPPMQTDSDPVTDQAGVSCTDGICSLTLDLDAVDEHVSASTLQLASGILRAAQSNISAVPSGAGLEVDDHVTLSLPIGNIDMFDADLELERADDGEIERFYGSANVPIPTLGLLGDLHLITPGKATIAYDTGAALEHLGAPLDPEKRYLTIHFGSGSERAVTDPAFSFTGDEGQNSLLLIVDPTDRYIHAVGNVMLVDTAQLLTEEVAGALGATGLEGVVPSIGLLPLPEQMGLRMAVLVTDNLADSKLELGGGYAVSGGPLAARFGLDVEPVAFEGTFELSDEGLAMVGKARSALQPGEVFAGEGSASVVVPLLGSGERASLALESNVDVPMFSFSDGRETLLVMPEIPTDEAIAAVRSQLAGSSDAVREGVEWVIVSAGDRVGDGTREGVEWATTAANRLGAEGTQLGDVTHEGMRWATDFVGNAAEYAAETADSGTALAGNFWCSRFGNCEPEATAAAE